MKYRSIIFASFIVILVSINFFLIAALSSLRNKSNDERKGFLSRDIEYAQQVNLFKEYINILYTTKINNNLKARFLAENPDFISEIKDGKRVVLFFKKGACAGCVSSLLQDLNILADKIGRNNIIVTSNLGAKEEPIKSVEYGFKTFYVETFFLHVEDLNVPLVFTFDENLNLDLLFVVDKYPKYQQNYFTQVLPAYFGQ